MSVSHTLQMNLRVDRTPVTAKDTLAQPGRSWDFLLSICAMLLWFFGAIGVLALLGTLTPLAHACGSGDASVCQVYADTMRDVSTTATVILTLMSIASVWAGFALRTVKGHRRLQYHQMLAEMPAPTSDTETEWEFADHPIPLEPLAD